MSNTISYSNWCKSNWPTSYRAANGSATEYVGFSNAIIPSLVQGGVAVVGIGAGALENKAQINANKEIASWGMQTQKAINSLQAGTEMQIQKGHDAAMIDVAKINATAPSAQKTRSNIIVIGGFAMLIVATIGIFYVGGRQQ